MKRCPSCGTENLDESKFCKDCGTSIAAVAPQRNESPVSPDTQPRSGRGQRFLLIAGAATIAIAIAIGGVWWAGDRVPRLPATDDGGRSSAGPTPGTAAQPAPPSATTIVGQPGVPGASGTTAPEPAQSPLFAGAGKIDSLEGEVRITSKSGERAAQAGLEVNEGDTIRTGANAWALIEMADGATITVRPFTQTRIETYRYAPDGAASGNRSVIALVKGALRVITGAIGQTNRRGYTISTQGATIGIRGTDHEPSYYPPGDAELAGQPPGTYDKVNDGETVIRNPRGEIAVRPGRSAFVHHDARAAPQLLAREPAFYQRHAGIDRRAAPRRTEIHQRVERDRQLRQKPSDAKSEKKTQQDRPKGPEKQQADKKGAKDQPKTGGAQAKTAQERQKTLEKQQADKKGAKDQAKTGGAQAKAAQERQKMLEKQQADKKGAKPEPKSQPKTPQELRQERLKEKEKQQAGKKDAKPQPKAGAQPKTPQELQKERLKEQEKQRADKTGAKPQPKAGARPQTPEELREERLKELERRRTQ